MAILPWSACSRGPATPVTPAASGTPTVEVVNVVQQPLEVTLAMPGELRAFQEVAMYPRVSAFVKQVRVDRGSRVKTGDLLAVLDAPELTAQAAEAQSKLQSAEAQLSAVRSKADADRSTFEKIKAASLTPGVVAGNDLTVAQKAMETGQSQVSAAEQNVEAARQAVRAITEMEQYLRVTAPFSGVVTERNVHPGTLVGAGGGAASLPMFRIVEGTRLRLVVPVPEAYTAAVVQGTAMPFTVAAYPGETFTATVARIAHAEDPKTRTMAVELEVPNADGRLSPGGFSQVRWPLKRPGLSLLVPSRSVASTTDRVFVVRIRNGRTEWVDVKTGVISGLMVEVFGGDLRAGDQVAARGTDELRAGVQVKAVKAVS